MSLLFYTYEEATNFLTNRKALGIKPGLERIKRLLTLLDHPERSVPAIHVAGTNGKGSTVQYIKNILQASGYKAGVFTSPSFYGYTGHFYINHTQMSKKQFVYLLNTVRPQIAKMDQEGDAPTEFEILTAIGWLYFSKHADIAIVEAGMGGREDTTNCFRPIISIITNVSYDHTQFIGKTLTEIAYHKAGIIKQEVPVILGIVNEEANQVFKREILLKSSPVFQLGKDFSYCKQSVQHFQWKWKDKEASLNLHMAGEHQIQNASLALMAACLLEQLNFRIDFTKAFAAVEKTVIPGRFEKMMDDPTIIIDAAHNPAGIDTFVGTIKNQYDTKNVDLLFAAFKDKNIHQMLDLLDGHFKSVTMTTFEHPRSLSYEELVHYSNRENVHIAANWQQIVRCIVHQKGTYAITGSFHFISMVRTYLQSLKKSQK